MCMYVRVHVCKGSDAIVFVNQAPNTSRLLKEGLTGDRVKPPLTTTDIITVTGRGAYHV